MCDSRRKVRFPIVWGTTIAVAVAVGLFVLFYFDPTHSSFFPPCPFHLVTGLHCPGCGSLRALHGLLHADLPGALTMNPLLIVSLPFLAILFFRPSWSYRPWLCWLAFGILLAYWVLRNVPVWPFVLLAPG